LTTHTRIHAHTTLARTTHGVQCREPKSSCRSFAIFARAGWSSGVGVGAHICSARIVLDASTRYAGATSQQPKALFLSNGVTLRPSGTLEGCTSTHTTPDSAWLYHLALVASQDDGRCGATPKRAFLVNPQIWPSEDTLAHGT
jgi:hypothetical protein